MSTRYDPLAVLRKRTVGSCDLDLRCDLNVVRTYLIDFFVVDHVLVELAHQIPNELHLFEQRTDHDESSIVAQLFYHQIGRVLFARLRVVATRSNGRIKAESLD